MLRSAAVVATEFSAARKAYVLFTIMVIYGLNILDRQVISILAAPIKKELGLSATQLGMASGLAFAVFYSVGGVAIARIADRWSRIWVISIGLATWSGFTALCGAVTSFTQLFLARIGVGTGEASGTAPMFALIADYFPLHQ